MHLFCRVGLFDRMSSSSSSEATPSPITTKDKIKSPLCGILFDSTCRVKCDDVNFIVMDENGTLKEASGATEDGKVFNL